jgi:hypothetical protein
MLSAEGLNLVKIIDLDALFGAQCTQILAFSALERVHADHHLQLWDLVCIIQKRGYMIDCSGCQGGGEGESKGLEGEGFPNGRAQVLSEI